MRGLSPESRCLRFASAISELPAPLPARLTLIDDGLVLAQNSGMLRLMRNLGFAVKPFAEDPDFRLVSRAL